MSYPDRVVAGVETHVLYERDAGSFSVLAENRAAAEQAVRALVESGHVEIETELEDGAILVVRSTRTETDLHSIAADCGPVYRVVGDEPAVPTGRCFVRFRREIDAESQRDNLSARGFLIESIPSYAGFACWVVHRSGIAAALREFENLRSLDTVEAVEPQFLVPSSHRGRL